MNGVPPSNGFVVVTHVYPQQGAQSDASPQTASAPPFNSPLEKFLKGEPAVLGTVQIMTGMVIFLFGIVTAFYPTTVSTFSGIMFWGAVIYITAGSLTIRANKKLSQCLVKGSLVMNVISTITSGIATILHSFDFIVPIYSYQSCSYTPYDVYDCQRNRTMFLSRAWGIAGVMLVLSLLEFIVSICVSAFACKATCSSNTQQVIFIPSQAPSFPIPYVSAPPLNTSEMPLFPSSVVSPFHHSDVDGLRSGKPEDHPPEYSATLK